MNPRSPLLACASLAALASPALAQTVHKTWTGFAGSKLGSAISAFHDHNGDGYQDVLLGAPGATSSHGYGVVYVVSGQALLQQNNYTILATILGNTTSDQFGATIETIGDLTGDGKPEFVVGATLDDTAATNAGRVFLYNGATLALLGSWSGTGAQSQLGWAIAGLGDWDADGRQEIAVSAPFDDNGGNDRGTVVILEITPFSFVLTKVATYQGSSDLDLQGYALDAADFGTVGGFANRRELIYSRPIANGPGGAFAGQIFVYAYNGSFAAPLLVSTHAGGGGDEYGFSLDASADVSGDGVNDLIVGAPYHDYLGIGIDNGFFHVWSGAALATGSLSSVMPTVWGENHAKYGWSVRGIADLNGDGRGEVLAGAPGAPPASLNWGNVGVFSGETGYFISAATGAPQDSFGEYVGPAIDLDGNGLVEYLAAGPGSDNAGTDTGVVRTIGLYPVQPHVYCSSKPNSLGCLPVIGWTGAPSASSGTFHIQTNQLLNNKKGLTFYGYNWGNVPFQGGTKCVIGPTKRLAVQDSGGSTLGNDCSGVLDYEFNALIQSGGSPELVAGQEILCQTWARDPQGTFTSSLSNGMRFVIAP